MNTSSATPDPGPRSASPKRRSYKGLSPDQRSQQRREKLLEASIQVFGTLGLRQTTMRDICHEARIAERYFSEHFANASEAYEAAFKSISEQALAAVGMAMIQAPLTTRDVATAGLAAFFQFVKEDPRRAQIMLIDASSYWSDVTIRSNPELNKHAWMMRHFAEMIYPELPVKRIDLEIIGSALIGASLQSCLTWAQGGFKQPAKTVIRHLMFIWDGLDAWFRAEIEAERTSEAAPRRRLPRK
jgi:AcrR family transcriptional regulator